MINLFLFFSFFTSIITNAMDLSQTINCCFATFTMQNVIRHINNEHKKVALATRVPISSTEIYESYPEFQITWNQQQLNVRICSLCQNICHNLKSAKNHFRYKHSKDSHENYTICVHCNNNKIMHKSRLQNHYRKEHQDYLKQIFMENKHIIKTTRSYQAITSQIDGQSHTIKLCLTCDTYYLRNRCYTCIEHNAKLLIPTVTNQKTSPEKSRLEYILN